MPSTFPGKAKSSSSRLRSGAQLDVSDALPNDSAELRLEAEAHSEEVVLEELPVLAEEASEVLSEVAEWCFVMAVENGSAIMTAGASAVDTKKRFTMALVRESVSAIVATDACATMQLGVGCKGVSA
mmetsp:Transcript_39544/g.100398  ORF Transcript_39544/g.100398 Transcript_39544/m.100398 type:complete len:127 (+) Transcript_39544:201-581(+)